MLLKINTGNDGKIKELVWFFVTPLMKNRKTKSLKTAAAN